MSHGPNERRCTSKNFGVSKSTLGTSAGPEGRLNRSQTTPHLSSRSGADQSGNTGEMGKVESGTEESLKLPNSVRLPMLRRW